MRISQPSIRTTSPAPTRSSERAAAMSRHHVHIGAVAHDLPERYWRTSLPSCSDTSGHLGSRAASAPCRARSSVPNPAPGPSVSSRTSADRIVLARQHARLQAEASQRRNRGVPSRNGAMLPATWLCLGWSVSTGPEAAGKSLHRFRLRSSRSSASDHGAREPQSEQKASSRTQSQRGMPQPWKSLRARRAKLPEPARTRQARVFYAEGQASAGPQCSDGSGRKFEALEMNRRRLALVAPVHVFVRIGEYPREARHLGIEPMLDAPSWKAARRVPPDREIPTASSP